MQPTAIDMPNLSFDINQLAIIGNYSLHTALSAPTPVGFFNPFAMLRPEGIKTLVL
jgi:hypothetical protein